MKRVSDLYSPRWQGQHWAEDLRRQFGLGMRPIPDLFEFIERLGIIYLRYPAGKDAVSGYAAKRAGYPIIFTNSNKSLGHENFTAAHEICHVMYDLPEEESVLVDIEISAAEESARETRANYFAACLLMPEDTIRQFVAGMGVGPNVIQARDILKIQHYFRVSYEAVLVRLRQCNLIHPENLQQATQDHGYANLKELTTASGFAPELIRPDGGIHPSRTALNKMVRLHREGYVPYGSFRASLRMLDLTPEQLGISAPPSESSEMETPDVSWDEMARIEKGGVSD